MSSMASSSSAWRATTTQLAHDLQQVFGARLRSVVAYGAHVDGQADGPVTALALVSSLTIEDLDACASHNSRWERQGLATPLILPEQEFHRSLDVFPLEYGEIVRAHAHVFGADPFQGAVIHEADLRRACELQVKSHLVHLREGYIEARGSTKAVAHLVAAAAPAFAALLRNVGHLLGVSSKERMDATRRGAQAAGIPEAVVDAVLALEHRPTAGAVDAARLFPSYLAAIEHLATTVDRWAE
jgi:hypothetical protein